MPLYEHRQGDTFPLQVTLSDDLDEVIPLMGCVVDFHMKARVGVEEVSGACTILDEEGGRVEFAWTEDDVDTAGVYDAKFEITYPDANNRSVPTRPQDFEILIYDDVA